MDNKTVERSADIICNAEFISLSYVALRCFGGYHYYRRVISPVISFHHIKYADTVYYRHYYIKQYKVNIVYMLFKNIKCFLAVCRFDYIIISAQHIVEHFAVYGGVVNNEYPGTVFLWSAHNITPLLHGLSFYKYKPFCVSSQ